jgi:hypothetical protein
MEAIEAEVLDSGRRDAKGRRMLPEHEWKRLLAQYENSGLIEKAFARRDGVSVHTLIAWLGRVRKRNAADQANQPIRFQEVSLPPSGPSVLEVQMPDGLVLKGSSPQDLAALVLARRR